MKVQDRLLNTILKRQITFADQALRSDGIGEDPPWTQPLVKEEEADRRPDFRTRSALVEVLQDGADWHRRGNEGGATADLVDSTVV